MNYRNSVPWLSTVVTLAASCWTCPAASSAAHPVSVTRTYVYVSREQATAKIDVFLEDLFLFHNLKPNDHDFLDGETILQGIELHKKFVAERFVIRDVAGQPVTGRVVAVQQGELPAEGVALAELMAHNLTFELQYEFDAPPEFLTFSQRFTDDDAVLPSEMKLAVKQENAGEPHTVELRPGDSEIVRFSWDLPPLSAEASQEEREKWVTRQKEETLGITSYSSVYSFLYINDYEVRHEILIPLLTLEQSVLIARNDDDDLDLDEQDVARQQIEAYFRTGNPIEIDGVRAEATVDRCDFFGLAFKDFAQQAPRKSVPMASARVGIILSYPCERPPGTVKLTWNRFNSFVWTVNTVVFAYDQMSKTTLTRLGKNNVFEWENPGQPTPPPVLRVPVLILPRRTTSLPVLSILCLALSPTVVLIMTARGTTRRSRLLSGGALLIAGAATWPLLRWEAPDPFAPPLVFPEETADRVFAKLHANMYRALEFHRESDIYDALAASIHGDLLKDVYRQMRQSLEMQEQGGAVSRVGEVSILEGEHQPLASRAGESPDAPPGFSYLCRWNVSGTVEHWGHIHERTNQYSASFTVEPVDNAWKVTNIQILDEQRLQFETRLRGL